MDVKEPKAVNELQAEVDIIAARLFKTLGASDKDLFDMIAGDFSEAIHGCVLGEWRIQKRYSSLVDYIIYQYGESGGEDLWRQVLLDLRMEKDYKNGIRLVQALYKGREKEFKVSEKRLAQHPNNPFCIAAYHRSKGDLMKLLYELIFMLENGHIKEAFKNEWAWANSVIEKLK